MFGPDVRHRTQPVYGDRISAEFRCTPMSGRRGWWLDVVQAGVEGRPDGQFLVTSRQGRQVNAWPLQPDATAVPADLR